MQVQAQVDRNAKPRLFLFRRLFVLLGMGLAHMILIWNGDILTIYAICGFAILPLINLHPAIQAVIGAIALFCMPDMPPFKQFLPPNSQLLVHAENAVRTYGHGSFSEMLQFRWLETTNLIIPLSLHILPKTFGYMLLGMASWRSGFLSLIKTPTDAPAVHILSAAGRMALSNYLGQSIIFSIIFYSYGFGLMGKLGSAATAAIALAVFGAQVLLSNLWLERFYFGPVEWLWRSLTYGRPQKFLRAQRDGIVG